MNRFSFLTTLAAIFVFQDPTFAQKVFHGAIYGNLGMPIGEMKEAIFEDRSFPGVGGGINVLINPRGKESLTPVNFGLEFNYLYLGKEKIDASPSYPPLKTNFNFVTIGPLIRFFPTQKSEGFTPFLDGGFGWKIMSTSTQINQTLLETLINGEEAVQVMSTKYGGMGLNLGIGFFNRKLTPEDGRNSSSFYMKILYQYGDTVNFVERGSIKIDSSGRFTHQTGRTKSSLILLQVGFSLQ